MTEIVEDSTIEAIRRVDDACREKDFGRMLRLCRANDLPFLGMFLSTTFLRQQIGGENNDTVKSLQAYRSFFHKTIVSKKNSA